MPTTPIPPLNSEDFIVLAPGPAGGLVVPLDAYRLLFELVDRDFMLSQRGEALLVVGPNGTKPDLSAPDIARIKRWKYHILAMLTYRAPEIVH